jgi:hypothetical protein
MHRYQVTCTWLIRSKVTANIRLYKGLVTEVLKKDANKISRAQILLLSSGIKCSMTEEWYLICTGVLGATEGQRASPANVRSTHILQ